MTLLQVLSHSGVRRSEASQSLKCASYPLQFQSGHHLFLVKRRLRIWGDDLDLIHRYVCRSLI